MGLFRILSGFAEHPLTKDARAEAIARYVRWQVGSRLLGHSVAVPFVGQTRLLASAQMTGATGNIYYGLHEFQDMAFVLHALRPDDLFVDVGANVGSYTVLAAGVCGAGAIAFEPIVKTFERLVDNVQLNRLSGRVDCRNAAIGGEKGVLKFTRFYDTTNHVIGSDEPSTGDNVVEVAVERLDDALNGRIPTVMKIDVEGFETAVIAGGETVLGDPRLQAVLMELIGAGTRYGHDEDVLHQRLLGFGFKTYAYDPLRRTLTDKGRAREHDGNTLYVRDAVQVGQRLQTAPKFDVIGKQV
ncbi:MAG TPA: FkbM family methyltransferase [Tepidisphaeraceae bacterium]